MSVATMLANRASSHLILLTPSIGCVSCAWWHGAVSSVSITRDCVVGEVTYFTHVVTYVTLVTRGAGSRATRCYEGNNTPLQWAQVCWVSFWWSGLSPRGWDGGTHGRGAGDAWCCSLPSWNCLINCITINIIVHLGVSSVENIPIPT